jgi:hypothetical protein
MPFVLESASYNIGYAIGQVIGVLILIGIPAGIGYVIYRLVRKKPASTPEIAAYDYKLEPMMPERGAPQGGPCPGCGNQAEASELYCANCGRQLRPIP